MRGRVESLLPAGTLEVSHLTLSDPLGGTAQPITTLHALLAQRERWSLRSATPRLAVLENRDVLPRAWLVSEMIELPPAAILAAIGTHRLPDGRRFDPRTTALIEDSPGRMFAASDATAHAEIVEYEPNAIELVTRSAVPAFLVLSETFYPGWQATVDGSPAPVVRTDYVLRGVELPAGTHHVRLVFRPRSVALGAALSALIAALLLAAAVHARRSG